jgi:SPP1 family predicted phage head-tail adaptor
MSPIGAGRLSKRIQIQRRSSTKDSLGEPLLVWSDIASVWADVQPLMGRELESARRLSSEVTQLITVRYRAIFSDTRQVAGYRALHAGRTFDIHACLDEDGAGVLINLFASEGSNDG